ncbi:unnamed protein product [Prunus armeniaca]
MGAKLAEVEWAAKDADEVKVAVVIEVAEQAKLAEMEAAMAKVVADYQSSGEFTALVDNRGLDHWTHTVDKYLGDKCRLLHRGLLTKGRGFLRWGFW